MNGPTWTSEDVPELKPLGWAGKLLVGARGIGCLLVTVVGFLSLVLCRMVERPLFGMARPWSPHLAVLYFRILLRVIGLPVIHRGSPMAEAGVIVANHSSWLDIFALNSGGPLFFVSKSEVSNWPVIGALARFSGTVFISRDRKNAQIQKNVFEDRLRAGHKLLFFPEGTSTDGLRVLPFKTTLFAAFFSDELRDFMYVQPVSVVFHAPKGQPDRFYGWWGDMDFAPHLLKTLGARRQGTVELIYHVPAKVSDFADRKALAAHCEEAVRHAHAIARLEK